MNHTYTLPMGPIRDWDDAISELEAIVTGIDDLVEMMTTATGVTVGIDTSELDSLKTQILSIINDLNNPHSFVDSLMSRLSKQDIPFITSRLERASSLGDTAYLIIVRMLCLMDHIVRLQVLGELEHQDASVQEPTSPTRSQNVMLEILLHIQQQLDPVGAALPDRTLPHS